MSGEKFNKFTWSKYRTAKGNGLTMAEARCLEVIFNHSRGDGTNAKGSYASIADQLDLKPRHVGDQMRSLVEKGWLEITRPGTRGINPTVYRLHPTPPGHPDHQRCGTTVPYQAQNNGGTVASEVWHSDVGGVAPQRSKCGTTVPPNHRTPEDSRGEQIQELDQQPSWAAAATQPSQMAGLPRITYPRVPEETFEEQFEREQREDAEQRERSFRSSYVPGPLDEPPF